MPAVSRKRRAPALVDSEDEADDTPQPTQASHQNARRRDSPASDDDEQGQTETAGDADLDENATGTRQQMVKKLVRLALASEYSRTPIRRADISAKVLGREGRQFRSVFDEAQMALRDTFGMEMVELPARERTTLKERRAAQTQQRSQGAAAQQQGTSSWVLRSLLPAKFRTPDILRPSKAPTEELEAAYVALYSFLIAVIMLNGGTLPEAKLERYLRRTNAEVNTPVERTDKLLQRMIKDGYLVRVKENVGGEEIIDYIVGTRGRVEVGEKGVEKLVRTVYGAEGDAEEEELEKKIERSLRVGAARTQVANAAASAAEETSDGARQGQEARRRGRPRRGVQTGGGNSDEGEDSDED